MHATGISTLEIAYAFEVTDRTVQRWLQDPELKRIVAELRETSLSSVAGLLQERCRMSANRLAALVESPDERIALAAVRTNLEMTLKVTEVAALSKQVAEMKAEMAILKGEAVKA